MKYRSNEFWKWYKSVPVDYRDKSTFSTAAKAWDAGYELGNKDAKLNMIQVIKGDLISLAKQGRFDVIVHGCNCFCTMGSGIAKQIKNNFPDAYEADMATQKGANKLGTYTVGVADGLIIINAYTQYDFGNDDKDRFDYGGFRKICRSLARRFHKHRFGFPMIGAGLANGNWFLILQIIQDELGEENVTIVELER